MSSNKELSNRGRKASPRLWALVRSLDDEKWKMVKAYSRVFGRDSQQFRLLELLRDQDIYDPAKEKTVLVGSNLVSMRNTAKKWLVRIVAKLGLFQEGLDAVIEEVQALIRWGRKEEAWEWLPGAKALAMESEEFEKLGWLLQQEYELASAMVKGENLEAHLRQLLASIAQNTIWIQLRTEVQHYAQVAMESSRRKFLLEGIFPYAEQQEERKSVWAEMDEDRWPVTILIEKLRVEEYLQYISQDISGASRLALRSLELIEANSHLAGRLASQYSKLLLRFATYQIDLAEPEGYQEVLEKLKRKIDSNGDDKLLFALKYLLVMFHIGFDRKDNELCASAMQEFSSLPGNILQLIETNDSVMVVLCVAMYHASQRQLDQSMPLVGSLVLNSEKDRPLALLVLQKIVHLIHLLAAGDRIGLESHGTNYRRFIKRYHDEESIGYKLILALARPDNLEKQSVKAKSKKQVIGLIEADQTSEKPQFRPFHWTLLEWVKGW